MSHHRAADTPRRAGRALAWALLAAAVLLCAGPLAAEGHSPGGSRLSDEVLPPQVEDIPERPRPLIELGDPFLGRGPIEQGVTLPTGATWRPRFMLFGTLRTGVNAVHRGSGDVVEWANRLDLFGNLQLSGTERILAGIRPLHADSRFTGYQFEPADDFIDATNARLTTLFFEGDVGEILHNLDREDSRSLDYGFSVGRQPHVFQDGMLLNDTMDSVMLTRNSLFLPGVNNVRLTGLFAWNDIHRGYNREDESALLYGLLTEVDTDLSTIEIDAVGATGDNDGGDALYLGLGSSQRLGALNSTFRANASIPLDGDTEHVTGGTLLFTELSIVPHGTHDNLYLNAFLAIDEFSSAARDQDVGGPLGRVGILFAATGLGTAGAPLSSCADRAFGGAVGYQWILAEGRSQLIFEGGGRLDTDGTDRGAFAFGARFQQAVGQHGIVFLDGFIGGSERDDELVGGRIELTWKF